jgi:LAO/AO transport system kinase
VDPSPINTHIKSKSRRHRSQAEFIDGIESGDRIILSEAITLLESTDFEKRRQGISILMSVKQPLKPSLRIGITGTPGVGKSTFIESFGKQCIDQGNKVAVLAIDPSSSVTSGSILGDKTRMESLSLEPKAYIRPTPSSTMLGGIAPHTQETISLVEAAGYDRVIIETVGIGQSEVDVDNIVDINILLLQPGAGDDMQGIKRGILEKVDIIVVHKADGLQKELATKTQRQYHQTMSMFRHSLDDWKCPVILCSSIDNKGHDVVSSAIDQFYQLSTSGYFVQKRKDQEDHYIQKFALDTILFQIKHNKTIDGMISAIIHQDAPLYKRISEIQSTIVDSINKI